MKNSSKLNYEKLLVYPEILQFLADADVYVCSWERIHATSDHYNRASEGILLCLAEASRAERAGLKQTAVDCSLGSMLECAACFDIAVAKGIMHDSSCMDLKKRLRGIHFALVAL